METVKAYVEIIFEYNNRGNILVEHATSAGTAHIELAAIIVKLQRNREQATLLKTHDICFNRLGRMETTKIFRSASTLEKMI